MNEPIKKIGLTLFAVEDDEDVDDVDTWMLWMMRTLRMRGYRNRQLVNVSAEYKEFL